MFRLRGYIFCRRAKVSFLRQARHLLSLGVDKLVVVVGLEHEALVSHLTSNLCNEVIKIRYNSEYATKGNMLSLWVARDECDGAVTFTTSDLFYAEELPPNFGVSDHSNDPC